MKNIFSRRVNHPELEDRELVALAKDDAEAFGELYARYVKKMYSYIFHRTGNTQDAEDLTAKVFIRAYSHIGNYVDRGAPFQAWLYRIAHNLVANWHRDQARRKIIALDDYVAHSLQSEAPERLAEDVEERDQLMEAVRRLPEERQQLLLLKFIEQLSNAEIGEIMGRTEGAIKSLYHRTLLALRDDMQRTPEAGQQRRLDGTEV
ncbi:MAG: sigma-70 family RNA polymerase sigma factor [Anaerolineae bacterium]|nr:sigma-70 family RNA polymerase sigma factor [Anaerolineae bacterium]